MMRRMSATLLEAAFIRSKCDFVRSLMMSASVVLPQPGGPYNIREDISESTDLSGKMKDKTSEMYKMLVKWRESVNANLTVKK